MNEQQGREERHQRRRGLAGAESERRFRTAAAANTGTAGVAVRAGTVAAVAGSAAPAAGSRLTCRRPTTHQPG